MTRFFFFTLPLVILVTACATERRPGYDAGPRRDGGIVFDGAGRDGGPGSFGYCPGTMPSAEDCRSNSDCTCGSCLVGPICGTGCAAQCASDADCTDGQICSGGCCPYCLPRCPTTACAEGTACNTATGRCEPPRCDAANPCPTNTRCTPEAPGTGCVRLTCTTDAECDCGTCAQGQCWDRPGLCCPPLPG